jgi:hypothetical protein
MSINACNINSHTIDAICGYRRSVIIDNLINDRYPPTSGVHGTNNSSVSADFARLRPDLVRHINEPIKPTWTFEVPQITVTVEIDGERKSYSLSAADGDAATVLASNLNLVDVVEPITVNISELEIDKK